MYQPGKLYLFVFVAVFFQTQSCVRVPSFDSSSSAAISHGNSGSDPGSGDSDTDPDPDSHSDSAGEASWPPTDLEAAGFYAYSWFPAADDLNNIIAFRRTWPWGSLDFSPQNIAGHVQALNNKPEGRRVLFIDANFYVCAWTPYGVEIQSTVADRCTDPDLGTSTPYNGIWWDRGVEQTRTLLSSFFQRLQEQGAKIDAVILDTEKGLSNWSIGGDLPRWRAIERDPRFAEIKNQMLAMGYAPPDASIVDTVASFGPWSLFAPTSNDNYLIWNELMGERVAAYTHRATYDAIKLYYPNVKLSDFDFMHHDSRFAILDFHGHRSRAYGKGAVVGTHQAPAIYGDLGQIRSHRLDGVHEYEATPFNAFRYDVNVARSAELASSVPLSIWVCYRSNPSTYGNTDFYQEALLHQGLLFNEEDFFIYFNSSSTPEDDQTFSRTLKELDQMTGFKGRRTLVDQLLWWGDSHVLTSAQVGSFRVSRLTLNLAAGSSVESVQLPYDEGVAFSAGSKKIFFPEGRIVPVENPVSPQYGTWIVQPMSAALPFERSE